VAGGCILVMAYRLYFGYTCAVAVTLALVGFHVAAFALEQAGLLTPASLLITPPSPIYDVPLLQYSIMGSVLAVYAAAFGYSNLGALRLRLQAQELRSAQVKLARAKAGAEHGRLSGETLNGSYELGEVVGRGGMGEIYLARRCQDNLECAVKILHPHLTDDQIAITRFQREVEAARRLPPSCVPEVLEISLETAERYIAMEYLRGEDLGAMLRRSGRLPAAEVAALINELTAAVDAAHDAQLVHRDLKPNNIFLVSDERGTGRIRLLDFGISKLKDSSVDLTMTKAILGSPGFLAPEQAQGESATVGPEADIFAIGAIAHQALTGERPFPAREVAKAIYQVVHVTPLRPSSVVPSLHPDVDAVIGIALAKDPKLRYGRASQFARDLGLAVEGKLDEALRERGQRLLGRTADHDQTLEARPSLGLAETLVDDEEG
jgi:serine/threonine protein kinase